ncbi:transcription antitermination nusG domain protein [Mycobacterium xenopi 3993]|nr:transcription antitermination nusG domain protein [Mycobacterium xenopi 3993]
MPSGETVDLAEAAEANPDVVADDAVAAEEQGAGEPAEELDPPKRSSKSCAANPGSGMSSTPMRATRTR